jgi:hypothetical protein
MFKNRMCFIMFKKIECCVIICLPIAKCAQNVIHRFADVSAKVTKLMAQLRDSKDTVLYKFQYGLRFINIAFMILKT